MRFVVFFFGSIGCLLTVAVGAALLLWDAFLKLAAENNVTFDESSMTSLTGFSNANAGLFILAAGCYGLLGSLFVLCRRGKQGGSLMLLPVFGAGFMNPAALPFASLQILMALTSFFIGPLPIPPSVKDDDD